MDLSFLIELGRVESRRSLDNVARGLALIPLSALAASQLLLLGVSAHLMPKTFAIMTLLARHSLVSLWETWSVWRPSQLLPSLIVYGVVAYNLWSCLEAIYPRSLIGGFFAVVLPLILFTFLDSRSTSIALTGDSSLLTIPIHARVISAVASSLEIVYAQSILPRFFLSLEQLPTPGGYVFSTAVISGKTFSSAPVPVTPLLSPRWADGVTLACVLFTLAVQLMLARRNAEIINATRMLGGWRESMRSEDSEEWHGSHAPYGQGAKVTRKGVTYTALFTRNTAKPGHRHNAANEIWKFVIENSARLTDWLLGLALLVLVIVKIFSREISSIALILFSVAAVVVHEVSFWNPLR